MESTMNGPRPGRARLALLLGGLVVVTPLAAPPASAADASAATESAEQLAERAFQLHAAGRYAEAIATYLQAYVVSSAAATLFNIATIYDRKLHEPELAADYYRRYLRAPDAEPELVQKANSRLVALKQAADDEARARKSVSLPAPSPTAASAAPPEPSSEPRGVPRASTWRTAGLVIGAAGAAGLGASVVLGLLAKGKDDEANALCNGASCSSERGVALAHEAGSLATAGTIAFAAGAALAVGGAALFLAAARSAPAPSAGLAVIPLFDPACAGLSVRAGF
jgi:tetratricopeptide (TPR) repeat protein